MSYNRYPPPGGGGGGSGDVTGPGSSVNTDLAIFSGTTGKIIADSGRLLSSLGDVVGPSSSVDNTIPRFDGVTGKLLQDSTAVIDDSGSLSVFSATTNDSFVQVGGSGAFDGKNWQVRSIGSTGLATTGYLVFYNQTDNDLTMQLSPAGILSINTVNTDLLNLYSTGTTFTSSLNPAATAAANTNIYLPDTAGTLVLGPGAATDTAVALWNGASGQILKDSRLYFTSPGGLAGTLVISDRDSLIYMLNDGGFATILDCTDGNHATNTVKFPSGDGTLLVAPTSTDMAIARYSGTAGALQDSAWILGALSLAGPVSGYVALGNASFHGEVSGQMYCNANVYYNAGATQWQLAANGPAGAVRSYNGGVSFHTIPTGTAGQDVTTVMDTTGIKMTIANDGATAITSTLTVGSTITILGGSPGAGKILTSDAGGLASWIAGGSGDVVGPGAATDHAVARWDGTTGKLLEDSVATLADDGSFSTAQGQFTTFTGFASGTGVEIGWAAASGFGILVPVNRDTVTVEPMVIQGDYVAFYDTTSEKMRIAAGGAVGIGLIPDDASTLTLQATGDDAIPVLSMRQAAASTYGFDFGIDDNVDGDLHLYGRQAGTHAGAEYTFGRDVVALGLGIAPATTLDVNGVVTIRGGTPTVGAALVSTDTTGTATWGATPAADGVYALPTSITIVNGIITAIS